MYVLVDAAMQMPVTTRPAATEAFASTGDASACQASLLVQTVKQVTCTGGAAHTVQRTGGIPACLPASPNLIF